MASYYNEIDPYAAQWLRNLIAAGHIAPGDVDERSIADLQPSDFFGYVQCHFFAGLGGWSYALRLAGWSDDRPVWTGSCPCQPFSVAGSQEGFDDSRHLWPEFARLIQDARPSTIFGEQVAGASDWLRLVRGDLDSMGYAVGCMPIEAASAGADHFRDRYWFVADCECAEWGAVKSSRQNVFVGTQGRSETASGPSICSSVGVAGSLAHGHSQRSQGPFGQSSHIGSELTPTARDRVCSMVNDQSIGWGEGWTEHEFRSRGFTAAVASDGDRQYVECPDGKWRRLPPPRVRWLGNGIPARVAKLRAFGNAIDPRPASQFIAAFLAVS